MNIIRTALAAASVLCAVGAASASTVTVTAQYDATNAVGNNANHSLWINNELLGHGSKSYTFDPAGIFTLFSDGTGTLTGRAESNVAAGSGFDVAFDYDDPDFSADFKSENGSAGGTDLFFKFLTGGTLTGFGTLSGLNLIVSAMPIFDGDDDGDDWAVQIGSSNGETEGPNNKNTNFGMAHWMFVKVDPTIGACTHALCSRFGGTGIQGDINVDLAPVPLPASALLLIGGLGALAMKRRRRS